MSHLQQNQKILNRIKRIQGQLNGVEKAIREGDTSCMAILQQVAAIKGAISGLSNELIEEQFTQHVLPDHTNPEALAEFVQLLRKYG